MFQRVLPLLRCRALTARGGARGPACIAWKGPRPHNRHRHPHSPAVSLPSLENAHSDPVRLLDVPAWPHDHSCSLLARSFASAAHGSSTEPRGASKAEKEQPWWRRLWTHLSMEEVVDTPLKEEPWWKTVVDQLGRTRKDEVPWKLDEPFSLYVNELKEATLRPCELDEEDMKVLEGREEDCSDPSVKMLAFPTSKRSALKGLIRTEKGPTLVRRCTESALKEILKMRSQKLQQNDDAGLRAVVTGNPGIGKSRSMETMLWYLLRESAVVVLEIEKENGEVYLCVPDEQGRYTVYFVPWEHYIPGDCAVANLTSTVRLVDLKSRIEPGSTAASTVLFASPNSVRYHEFMKTSGSVLLYQWVWTLPEMLTARHHMLVDEENGRGPQILSADEVVQRCDRVGCIPRFVFCSDNKYHAHVEEITGKLRTLSAEHLQQMLADGPTEQAGNRISSKLVGIFAQANPTNNPTNYRAMTTEVLCSYMAKDLPVKLLWKEYQSNPSARNFERWGLAAVAQKEGMTQEHVAKDVKDNVRSEWSAWVHAMKSHGEGSKKLIVPLDSGFPLVDCMGSNGKVYQFTSSADHAEKADKWKKNLFEPVRLAGGTNYLDEKERKLELVFVVPHSKPMKAVQPDEQEVSSRIRVSYLRVNPGMQEKD
eukprot:TRINITY_DN2558_c0_g1_i5.p1 TRINITY_DN2558_c0_g1~~TRINITY_DN2558_c0_g1_i5.p1  ORF type:complete len:659 (-),score=115.49 TRINITY_DN2558_c0_g1_i5:202-2154(-)